MPAQKKKSTATHTYTHVQVHNQTRARAHTHMHTNTQLRLRGCIVTGTGTKQLSAFCHVKPRRNTPDRKQRPRHRGGLLPLSHTHSLYYFVLQWWKEVCTSQRFLPLIISALARDCQQCKKKKSQSAFPPLRPLKTLLILELLDRGHLKGWILIWYGRNGLEKVSCMNKCFLTWNKGINPAILAIKLNLDI